VWGTLAFLGAAREAAFPLTLGTVSEAAIGDFPFFISTHIPLYRISLLVFFR
jgi:hypothetical protein